MLLVEQHLQTIMKREPTKIAGKDLLLAYGRADLS